MKHGIDVSSYQGKIDWNKAKAAGVEFAILKVIRKDLSPDKQFEANWNNCLEADIPIQSVYNYTYATNKAKSAYDANKVLEILGADRHPRVILDIEDKSLPTGRVMADIINVYGDVITAGGCQFGIYTGMNYYDSYLSNIMPYVKEEYRKGWEARYYNGYNPMKITDDINQSKCPTHFNGALLGWQYSSSGRVDGINGNVDLDVWYEDIEAKECAIPEEKSEYNISDFILDSRKIWNVSDTASAKEIVAKTVTVSTSRNRSHSIVTPLERYMQALGYYNGRIEADSGKMPIYGNGMKKAIILYQSNIVRAIPKNQDGILSAKGATWKTLYGVKEEAKSTDKVIEYSLKEDGERNLSENFQVKEFRCKDGSDKILISDELVEVLQKIRNHFGKAVNINSAYRSPSYNKKIGGATNSQHMYGTAADIRINGITPKAIADYAETLLPCTGGIGRYNTFAHVDVRDKKARWNG